MFAALSNQSQQQQKKEEMLARGASQAEIDKELAEMDKNFNKMLGNVALGGAKGFLTSGGNAVAAFFGALFRGLKS